VPQNYDEAAKWFRLAADQGHVVAQDVLGGLYFSGRGVLKDYVVAYMWLSLSAA
jgi:TPR repeat protein